MCCTNGGAFIKVGQHVGSLEYLLPKEYVDTMKVLHNKAPQSDVEELKKVFEEDLKMKASFARNNLKIPLLMMIKYTKLNDPGAYGSVYILPTRSRQTDRQTQWMMLYHSKSCLKTGV
jgi:hypothetical protein